VTRSDPRLCGFADRGYDGRELVLAQCVRRWCRAGDVAEQPAPLGRDGVPAAVGCDQFGRVVLQRLDGLDTGGFELGDQVGGVSASYAWAACSARCTRRRAASCLTASSAARAWALSRARTAFFPAAVS
jgi:hypothetical protein